MNERSTKPRGPIGSLNGRSSWFWMLTLLVALPPLYMASYGPACWLNQRGFIPDGPVLQTLETAYWPMDWLLMHGPEPIRHALADYAGIVIP